MTTREQLEDAVRSAEAHLADAKRSLQRYKDRPTGCQCDPDDWSDVPGPICATFEADTAPGYETYCRHCEHPVECHGGISRCTHEEGEAKWKRGVK
jgi:hypothetical protein